MKFRPGELDRVVTIQQVTNAQDTDGATTQTWTTLTITRAKKLDLRMSERLQAMQVEQKTWARYLTRYDSSITEKMRLIDGSNTYEIIGVMEIGRRRGLELVVGTT